jgi:VWFA-related protein
MNTSAEGHLRRLVTVASGLLASAVIWQTGLLRAQSAQNGSAPPATSPSAQTESRAPSNAPELDMRDSPVALRTQVNVVPVRVVVRDQDGRAVGDLQREDFRLLEDGKPQDISNFTVETPASLSRGVVQPTSRGAPTASSDGPAFLPPSRFVALVFDDEHLNLEDLVTARNAAGRYVDRLTPADRAAVFTVSGQNQADFTEDRAKLHDALGRMLPISLSAVSSQAQDCPPMEFYEADQIVNQNDQQALAVAITDTITCLIQDGASQDDPTLPTRAAAVAESTARSVFERNDVQIEDTLRRLRELITRLAALPGQRTMVLISPGFIYPTHEYELEEIFDKAIRANVFISTLDARGLYVPELGSGDISTPLSSVNPQNAGYRTFYRITGGSRQIDFLMELANATGGFHFENNNDLEAGLRELASPPEAYYMLGFTPQGLKDDGRFHSLKVSVVSRGKEKYTIQARPGFYAPRHGETPKDAAKQDIEDAVFSQEEQHGLSVGLETQFYKTDAMDAKLAVLAHVNLAHMHFNKADGRNLDDLTVVAALFDRNGNFITGTQKVVEMKLRDDTLEKLSRTGMTVRTNFDVKPGDYVVRLVVRDSQAALLSAENGVVEIPY